MPKVRSVGEISAKWKDVTPRREAYYRRGIEDPKEDWQERAAASADAWKGGVEEAARELHYPKGVAEAGTGKWKSHTLTKGVEQGRWRAGVTAYAGEYSKGFAPFRDAIEATTLPPRYARGDERNYERVKAMGIALHKKRLEKYR